jgi:hypothetical protein
VLQSQLVWLTGLLNWTPVRFRRLKLRGPSSNPLAQATLLPFRINWLPLKRSLLRSTPLLKSRATRVLPLPLRLVRSWPLLLKTLPLLLPLTAQPLL